MSRTPRSGMLQIYVPSMKLQFVVPKYDDIYLSLMKQLYPIFTPTVGQFNLVLGSYIAKTIAPDTPPMQVIALLKRAKFFRLEEIK